MSVQLIFAGCQIFVHPVCTAENKLKTADSGMCQNSRSNTSAFAFWLLSSGDGRRIDDVMTCVIFIMRNRWSQSMKNSAAPFRSRDNGKSARELREDWSLCYRRCDLIMPSLSNAARTVSKHPVATAHTNSVWARQGRAVGSRNCARNS